MPKLSNPPSFQNPMIEKFKYFPRNKTTTLIAFGISAVVVFTLTMIQQWLLLAGFIHAVILLSSFVFALTHYEASWGHKVIAVFLLTWSNFVFTALILSPFNRLNSLPLYAVLSCSLAIVSSLAIRQLSGKRQAMADCVDFPAPNDEPFRFSPLVSFTLFFVIVAIVGSLLIAVFYYPTNGDAVSYRLPRAFFYVGQSNLNHPAENMDYRSLYYPFNGILAYIPNVLYQLDGRSFNGLSFISWMLCGLGVYLFGRDLGASKTGSLLAACFYLSAPIVMILATSTNDDSIAAAPLMMGLLFLYRWWQSGEAMEVILAGIGAGLSVGTKLHIAFFAPVIIAAAGILLFKLYRQDKLKQFFQQRLLSLIATGIMALILVVPFAAINFRETGHLYVPTNYIVSGLNSPFNLKNAIETNSVYSAQLFLSPIPDLIMSNDDAQRQTRAKYNDFLNHTLFFWIKPEDNFDSIYYEYQGVADPYGTFSEYDVWLGFSPIIILSGILALFASRKYTFSFPAWLLLSFFIWHFTYTIIQKFGYNISTYYTFPFTICAAGMAVVWDAQSDLKKQTAGLIKFSFVVVAITNAIFMINILRFNAMRNLPDLFNSGFSPEIPFVSKGVKEALKGSNDINIVRTHWATMYFDMMSQNTAANYSTFSMIPKDEKGLLNILTYQTAGRWGNVFIQLNEKQRKKEYLTLLGLTRDQWSPELVFGKGNNLHLTKPEDSGYIVYMGRLEMDQGMVMGDYLCAPYKIPSGGVHPIGFDKEDFENAEQRLLQYTPNGDILIVRDWEHVRGCDYYPLVVPASDGYLSVQIRFKSEPKIISEGFLPLRVDQEYRFLGSPTLTTAWREMYDRLQIYDTPAAKFISIDPVLSNIIWFDPNSEHLPPTAIHLDQNNNSVLWLGQGTGAGFTGTIWAAQAQEVEFRYEIEPTANTETDQRTVSFELFNTNGIQVGQRQFNGATQLVFRGTLTPGPNQFQLTLLDTPSSLAPVPDSPYPPLGLIRNFRITMPDKVGPQSLSLLPPMQAGPLHAPLITLDESLSEILSVSPIIQIPLTWGIEFSAIESWLWLGHGETEGVGFTLNSQSPAPQKVRLEFRVLRGPANESNQRTLQLAIENTKGTNVEHLQFTEDLYKETTISYDADLVSGTNKINLKVLEEATVSLLPQDPRPLLVRLLHITVLPIVE